MQGRSVLLITHRVSGLATLVDQVTVMVQGRIAECMATAAYLEQIAAHEAPSAPALRLL